MGFAPGFVDFSIEKPGIVGKSAVDGDADGPCDGDPCPACAAAPVCPVLFDHCSWGGDCNAPMRTGQVSLSPGELMIAD